MARGSRQRVGDIAPADEHERIEAALDDLDEIDSTAPEWTEILHELEGMLEEHIEEEEDEIFTVARDRINDDCAAEMVRQYAARKLGSKQSA